MIVCVIPLRDNYDKHVGANKNIRTWTIESQNSYDNLEFEVQFKLFHEVIPPQEAIITSMHPKKVLKNKIIEAKNFRKIISNLKSNLS